MNIIFLDVDGVLYDLDSAPVDVGIYRIYALEYCINNIKPFFILCSYISVIEIWIFF